VSSTVIVQSDSLSAWIGVAGVAVGVALAAGVESSRLSHDDVTKISLRPVSFSSAGCESSSPPDRRCAVAGLA
jgi:hypothetical protein